MKFFSDIKGSALLTALMVMGVLISISLVLSSLVMRELRVTTGLMDAGRAYYAAESGVEVALYGLNNELPGWQPGDNFEPLRVGSSVAEYKVDNRCSAYPCFESGFDVSTAPLTAYYDVLDLNQSITVPLFVLKDEVAVPVEDFTVEFYVLFDPQSDLNFKGGTSGWDVLRWKVLGIRNGETETISDFTAATQVGGGDEFAQTGAKEPSWFGTMRCNLGQGRYTSEINCIDYVSPTPVSAENLGDELAKTYIGTCPNTHAREYYDFQGNRNGGVDSENIHSCYSTKQFLQTHDLNYLTLTNLMNPSALNPDKYGPDERQDRSKIFYRVELFGGEGTVREFAEISSKGYSGGNTQSVNVKVRRGGFMPVFNFSLYSTYKKNGYGDWYQQ